MSLLFGLIVNVFHLGLIFSTLSDLIIGNMIDKKDQLRLNRVSRHASVHREITKSRYHRSIIVYLI